MNPIENPEAYKTAKIGGATWPGYVTISPGSGIPRNWKKNKGTASSGATADFEGDDLAEFECVLLAWKPEHFTAYDAKFKAMLEKAPEGKDAKAIDFEYPTLAAIGVTAVNTQNVPALEQVDPLGVWGWKYKFQQHRAPTPAKGSPNGSASPQAGSDGVNGGAGGDAPVDPVDQEIADLTQEFNDEANGGTAP